MKRNFPQIHGHRGARGLYPENTLAAIRAGIDCGCDAIEVDLCVSADNQLVIHHDPILSPRLVRDKTGKWISHGFKVRDLSLAELKNFDVGRINPESDYAGLYPQQIPVEGARIPVLGELVDLVTSMQSNITYNLELKSTPHDPKTTLQVEEYVELVIEALKYHGIVSRTFLQSFDWRLVMHAKSLLPNLKTGMLTNQQTEGNPLSPIPGYPDLWTSGLDLSNFDSLPGMVKHAGGDVWSCNDLDISRSDVITAHRLELEVYVWTVNSETQMQKMIDYGVDAIITDYPDRLYKILN
jgi:glycerophosphoryl diester phosphodiesterase